MIRKRTNVNGKDSYQVIARVKGYPDKIISGLTNDIADSQSYKFLIKTICQNDNLVYTYE